MRPTLNSQHLDDGLGIRVAAPDYASYSASAQHVDPAIEHGISDFAHSHGHSHGEEHHAASHHSHLQHGSLHLEGVSSEQASINRHHYPESPTLLHHEESVHPAPRAHHHAPVPGKLSHIQNDAPTGHFDMLPPVASTHSSWQALHDYAQSHASAHGYALSINTTAKNRSRIKLACVCYGAPKNTHKLTPETRVRKNRVSYKTGCKMWIEGKRHEDGSWVLRVGEPTHNHPGRSIEGWAVQRKRTWGVQGGRIGVGGVTAKEEKERLFSIDSGVPSNEGGEQNNASPDQPYRANHSLERGGLVWKIVEQEMLRKGGPGQGRDRGVGRTVKVLEERLPGIHIFKRDIYNIRAQIKRARKAAGQQIGEGLDDSDDDEAGHLQDGVPAQNQGHAAQHNGTGFSSEIDPMLVAQCSDALKKVTRQESEVDGLKKEVVELRNALAQRGKEIEEKDTEIENLRVQLGLANMALYNGRCGHAH